MSYHGRELRLGDKVNYCNDKFPFTVVKSGNYYGLQISNNCESIWLSNTLNDLTNLMRDKTTYEWFLIEENNMETIKFENNEYVWEEIEGKGRCLIPYVKPKPTIKVGDCFYNSEIINMVVRTFDSKFEVIMIKGCNADSKIGTSFGKYSSLEELQKQWNPIKVFSLSEIKDQI